jgi:hypothetical protein
MSGAVCLHRQNCPDLGPALPNLAGEPEPNSFDARLGTRLHLELPQDGGDVGAQYALRPLDEESETR